MNTIAGGIALAMLGVYFITRPGAQAGPVALSVYQVRDLAQFIVSRYNFNADTCMLTAMAIVESGDVNNLDAGVDPLATRFEGHLGDASTGIMQTLGGTARWLATDMGYNAYGVPDAEDLFNPEISMYFGAAYVDWLSNWRGRSRDQSWIVQSYNGGPGNSNSQTQNHLNKYRLARQKLNNRGVC